MRASLPRAVVAAALLAGIWGAEPRADEANDPWEEGKARWFLSSRLDLGTFEHLGLAGGWGKPHWLWGGAEIHGVVGLDFGAVAANLRLALLVGDLWAGLRVTRAWKHVPMADVPSQVAIPKASGFTYRTLDLFGSGVVPTPGGLVLWEANFLRFLDAPEGAIYEEWLRVVCVPPWCGVARLGWVANLRDGALRVGLGAEWAFLDGRGGPELVRLGPIASWRIWPHVVLAGYVYWPVSDPDQLGFLDRVNATVVLSYTFATGTPPPRFP
jgi:hypothetical protein